MSNGHESGGRWTLLTGHGHVLVEIARNPDARIRDISPVVGLAERTVQAIVADLEAAGYLTRTRVGRRNRYTVHPDSSFRHSAQERLRVGPFLAALTASGSIQPGSRIGLNAGREWRRGQRELDADEREERLDQPTQTAGQAGPVLREPTPEAAARASQRRAGTMTAAERAQAITRSQAARRQAADTAARVAVTLEKVRKQYEKVTQTSQQRLRFGTKRLVPDGVVAREAPRPLADNTAGTAGWLDAREPSRGGDRHGTG